MRALVKVLSYSLSAQLESDRVIEDMAHLLVCIDRPLSPILAGGYDLGVARGL